MAILHLASGLGSSFTDPEALGPAYQTSMLICAALLVGGGLLAFAAIPSSFEKIAAELAVLRGAPVSPRVDSPVRMHCAVTVPPLHPEPVRRE